MAAIVLGGERVALRMTWGHIRTLRDLYGPEFDSAIQAALAQFDVERIAEILSVLTGRTAAAIMEESPALVPTVGALGEALIEAFNGPGRKPEKEAAESGRPFLARIRQFLARWFARFRRGLSLAV